MKLIILYGFAASGKSTLAKKYTDNHPMSIAIEGDELIGMIGGWRGNESKARDLVFEYTKSIADIHLQDGNDVIIPNLLNDVSHSAIFQQLATKNSAEFYEIYIDLEKEEAVKRLIDRGCWGEAGSRKLTEDDRVELESRFDYMENMMHQLSSVISIESQIGDVDDAYESLVLSFR
jgi:predicted kinase